MNLQFIWIFLIAGLLGSIPFGIIVSKLLGHDDPRESGSGNIGATNVLRASGWAAGLFTLGGDIAKGVAALLMIPIIFPAQSTPLGASVAASAAVLGHMYSPFTGFQGGKGVATGLGVFAILMPIPTIWAAAVFAVSVASTKHISLGSILAALTIPIAGYFAGYPGVSIGTSAFISALIVWRHQGNIARLARGEENRFGSSSK